MPSKESEKSKSGQTIEALAAQVKSTNPVAAVPGVRPVGHSEAHAAMDEHIAKLDAEYGTTSPEAEEARRLANIVRYVK